MTLAPLKEARTKWDMNRVVTFDIESHDWVNPVSVGFYNGSLDMYYKFTGGDCISKFADEIMRSKWDNHYFVAHYGGDYDFIPIIEELSKKDDIELQILTRGSSDSPFFVRIDNGKRPRYLQDSFALMPRGLKGLTESFAPEYQKMEYDLDKIDEWENMSYDNRDEMLEYLKRDCEGLYEVLESFTDIVMDLSNNNCPCQITMGSTAMGVYRTTFMPDIEINNCYQPEQNIDPESKFRDSYFGGRTEVYKKYGKDLYHYDVNSLYPHCYTNKPIPAGDVMHTGERFPYDSNDIGGVIKIKGTVPKDACNGIPVLPRKITSENFSQERVVFPYGEIEGWFMAKEVRYADQCGALKDFEILDSYASEYKAPFEAYGKALYEKKKNIDKEKHPGEYRIVKFLLNSFYGKFGMDREHKTVVKGPVSKEFQEGKEMINDELANMGIMLEEEESDAQYILPRIASAITSQARIEMHKWFTKVFDRGGSIWYCDTDSIVTDVKLPTGEDLGEMDLEGTLEKGIYLAPKVYAEKYKDGSELVKAKGMKNPKVRFEHYERAYLENNPELIHAEWETPRGFKAGMKNGNEDWFEKVKQTRSLRQFDQKRNYEDGKSYPVKIE